MTLAISDFRLNFLGGHSTLDTKKGKVLAGAARPHYFQWSLTFSVFGKKRGIRIKSTTSKLSGHIEKNVQAEPI